MHICELLVSIYAALQAKWIFTHLQFLTTHSFLFYIFVLHHICLNFRTVLIIIYGWNGYIWKCTVWKDVTLSDLISIILFIGIKHLAKGSCAMRV